VLVPLLRGVGLVCARRPLLLVERLQGPRGQITGVPLVVAARNKAPETAIASSPDLRPPSPSIPFQGIPLIPWQGSSSCSQRFPGHSGFEKRRKRIRSDVLDADNVRRVLWTPPPFFFPSSLRGKLDFVCQVDAIPLLVLKDEVLLPTLL
jgi:hypothetical protein